MIETNEPKDGDFIAYIEQLQKQQAARLDANRPQGAVPAAQPANKRGPFDPRASLPAAEAAHAARERFRRSAPSSARLVGAALPVLVGVLVGLHWLIGGSGLAQLVVALVLIFWGARRFRRVLQGLASTQQAQASALISQLISKLEKR